jgi:uroporphyrinogen-III decarboxylase
MTNRERILAILEGRCPDRIPWIPRLRLWYESHRRDGTLPAEYRGRSLRQVEQDVFGGTAARDGVIFRTQFQGVEVRTRELGDMDTLTEYVTPVGTLTSRRRSTEQIRRQGIRDVQTEFLLKRREDYAVMEYIVEHTAYEPTFDEFERYDREIGDDGYPMVHCGDCPFHHWMQALAGYDQAFYHLNDFPDTVERLLAVVTDRLKATAWRAMADSPARLLVHGHHFSSQMTPPPLFARYILPYYQELSPLLRSRGKVLALHGDGDTQKILSHIERAGFGMVECFATAPMVNTTLSEARAAWGERVTIWGGVPSSILEAPYTDAQFEQYMNDLLKTISPGRAFILGIADNAMPGSDIRRIRRITEIVKSGNLAQISGQLLDRPSIGHALRFKGNSAQVR